MSFISANVLSMKRSTREPVPPSEAGWLQTRFPPTSASLISSRTRWFSLSNWIQKILWIDVLKKTKTKRSIYVIVITRFWTAICVKEWNLAERRRTGKPKRADSGERSAIRCSENKIPQPYAVHRSVVGLFLSRRFRLITIITSRVWAPINHTDFEIM